MPKQASIGPPSLSLKLIRRLCKQELVEELEGNLHEYHDGLNKKRFKTLKYWYQVFNYLRPSTLKATKLTTTLMFNFNPALTIRNLYRHKSTSLISILGFTFGLVATVFLYFYIHSELSYDSFHEDKDQIYRAARMSEINGTPYNIGVTSGPYARGLENDFPSDVYASTRAYPNDGLVTYGEKKFFEDQLLFVDENFFRFFSFPLQTGDSESVLDDLNAVVLSKQYVEKYFGEEDPIGKVIMVDNQFPFTVTGIMDDFPAKSHLEFDMVFPIALFDRFEWFNDWWNNGLITYVKVATPAQAERVKAQLPGFMDKYFGDDFEEAGRRIDLTLEPFNDVYFNYETRYDQVRHGNLNAIITLGIVAIAILFIACFNYVNLSIAQSFMRAKEVSVRKVLGVSRTRLILQFLGESLMILFFAILLSIGICQLLSPLFNSFFGLDVQLNWLDPNVLMFFAGLILLVIFTSGIYPALLTSSFKPVAVLKGGKLHAGKNVGLRKGLVIAQFTISIFLIIASLLISAQTNYLNTKDLGFNKEAVILIDLNNSQIRSSRETFKNTLLENANIQAVTGLSGEPGGFHDVTVFQLDGIEENNRMRTVFTDLDYLNVFDIDLVDGRNFSKEIITDASSTMIINESGLEQLGIPAAEAIGKKAVLPSYGNIERTIIGIAKDYHFNSLKDNIEPLAIIATTDNRSRRLAVKVNPENMNETLLFIDEAFTNLSPEFPMSYDFIDQSLARLYENEQKQGRVFSAFSGISILLACLGIFGLAAYSAQQRQKELGIRKVLGATARQIIGLISKQFLILVLIAAVVAAPAVWYFMDQWLGGFAYRIRLIDHWYVFILAGGAAILIALFTVTFKTYRAAVSDPTESIRNE